MLGRPHPAHRRTPHAPAVLSVATLLALTAVVLEGPLASAVQPSIAAPTVPVAHGATSTALGPSAGVSARTIAVTNAAQLQNAINGASPGDQIHLAPGTYSGPFSAQKSGTSAAPITVSAPQGGVKLTAKLPMPSCGATGPDTNRTLSFTQGASHWVVRGLQIEGGISIASKNADAAQKWMSSRVAAGDWQGRRAVPGRATYDPAAARKAVAFLSKVTGQTIVPSENIQLIANTVTKKGVFGRMARYGVLDGNTITDVACGTGPAVWFPNFSDGWVIKNNTISRVAPSSASHYMQEGIRIGSASDYNVITKNVVRDLGTGGRAFTTDVDASWNTFSYNTADGIDIGFNDQQSGWGNTWDHNAVKNFRTAGFSFRMKDGSLPVPSKDTSTYLAKVTCNVASGSGVSLQAGALIASTFRSNSFSLVDINPRLAGYWSKQGNSYDGSSSAPSQRPKISTAGC